MSADRRPLCHLLYTNVPGEDGHGFRFLAVGFQGTQTERQEIEGWLMGLKLSGEQKIGWATSSFAVNRSPCFALAMVDSTRFPLDELGRPGGILVHAFLVPLVEGRPVGDFGRAVFDKAKKFLEESGSPTLGNYLQGCRVTNDLEIPNLQYLNFRGLDPQFLEIFYSAAYDRGRGAPVLFPGYTPDPLPDYLLTASAVLPPRLRLNMSWRVGLQAGKEGFVARVASGSAILPAENPGTAYLAAVRAQLAAGQDDRVARLASSDWALRSWSGLQKAWDRPEAEKNQVSVGANNPGRLEGSGVMAKKGLSVAGIQPAATPRAKDRTARDEDYQALEQDLRDYLERRLIQLGTPPERVRTPPERVPIYGPSKGSSWRFLQWFQKWRPEVYFLVLLLLVIASFLKPAPPGEPSLAYSGPSPSPVPDEPTVKHRDPLGTWEAFVENPQAAGWFQAVAEARGLSSSQINHLRKIDFYRWSEKLKQQEPLTETELASSRVGFFEYAHARWAKDNGVGKPDQDMVTLDPMEVAPHLKSMAIDLGLVRVLGSSPSVDDEKVQAAIALAWIRQQGSP